MTLSLARTRPLVGLLLCAASACAKLGAVSASAVPAAAPSAVIPGAGEAQRAWWRAFVLADTATLGALSTPGLLFIASTGHTFDRSGTIAEAATNSTGSRLTLAWTEEREVVLRGGEAVMASARVTETEGRTANHYRVTSILERSATSERAWRVAAVQRTRETVFTPRMASAEAGDIAAYAGRYRVPSGAALVVTVQDSALTLTDPNGAVLRLEPVAPAVFESTRLSGSNGIVRFAFARDERGHVVALSRLIQGGILTFPRVQSP